MDRPEANRSFDNTHINDVPMNYSDADDFLNGFNTADTTDIDEMLDFIFSDESNSSTSSDSTISEETHGMPSASHTIGNYNQNASVPIGNGANQAEDEAIVLLKLNKKIKKVEKEVDELRKSIASLCKQ